MAENTGNRPNFFCLLELNPDIPWNEQLFKEVLESKRKQWVREKMLGGETERKASFYIELFSQIEKVMSDAPQRLKEAEEARKIYTQEREFKKIAFSQALALLNAQSCIQAKTREQFIREFSDLDSREALEQQITVPLCLEQNRPPLHLDETTADTIAGLLQFLHKPTLYEFLSCRREDSTPVLRDAAEQLLASLLVSETTQTYPTKSIHGAARDTAAHAMKIFESDEMRKAYDEVLSKISLNTKLLGLVNHVERIGNRSLSLKEVTLFLDDLQKDGWDREVAQKDLTSYAKKRRWSIEVAPFDPINQPLLCGNSNCRELNDRNQDHCKKCGDTLYITCPDCGRSIPCEHRACGKCGFPVGNHYSVDAALKDLHLSLQQEDTDQAQVILHKLKLAWQPKQEDERLRTIRINEELVQNTIEQQQAIYMLAEKLFTQKQYPQAKEQLQLPEMKGSSQGKQLLTTIDAILRQVQELLKRASMPHVDYEERVELCRQAIQLYPDNNEAQKLRQTLPPSPPTHLQAHKNGCTIRLSWTPSPAMGAEHVILRKLYTPPESVQDGEVIARVTSPTYEDTTPTIGLPIYYAIYAEYDQLVSTESSSLAEAVLLMMDVQNVSIEPGNHCVVLSWNTPEHTHSIVIVRKESTRPHFVQDGIRIIELSPTQTTWTDDNLQNERSYYYGIYCTFLDQYGQSRFAPGVIVNAIPETPPEPPGMLQLMTAKTSSSRIIEISWISQNPPNKGNLVILRSNSSMLPNQIVTENNIKHFRQLLTQSTNQASDIWIDGQIIYYAPAVLYHKMAYIGSWQRFVCIDPIHNIRGKLHNAANGPVIRLQWAWPECDYVYISVSMEHRVVAIDDQSAQHYQVGRHHYLGTGHFDIKVDPQNHYFMTFWTIIIHEGLRFKSQEQYWETPF